MKAKYLLYILPILKLLWTWVTRVWQPAKRRMLYMPEFNSYCYTKADVSALRAELRSIGGSAPAGLWLAPVEVLQMCFNGIGPQHWSTKKRMYIGHILEECMSMALAHDYEFTCSPRTYIHFSIANARLIVNGVLEAFHTGNKNLIWYGIVLAVLSQLFGWRLYRDFDVTAWQKRMEDILSKSQITYEKVEETPQNTQEGKEG